MALSRKNAVRLLALGGAALVALVIVLILGLRDRGADQPRFKAAPPPEAAATAVQGELPARSPRTTAGTPRSTPRLSSRPRTTAPARRGGIRRAAPSALPAEISREKDPQRRAELLRMHKLATARVRASVLKRRQALLANTIAKEREQGSPEERIRRLEGEMAELRIALRRAEKNLSQASAATKAAGK